MSLDSLVPSDGLITACEINCRLMTVEADSETGCVRSAQHSVPVYPEISLSNSSGHTKFLADYAPVITIEEESGERPGLSAGARGSPALNRIHSASAALAKRRPVSDQIQESLPGMLSSTLRWLFPSSFPAPRREDENPRVPAFAWHPRDQVLAAADTADRVHVYNLAAGAPVLGNAAGKPDAAPAAQIHPEIVLYHEFQRQVGCVSWRPPCGSMMAVGCLRGVCLWTIGGGPGGQSTAPQSGRAAGTAWMTFLRTRGSGPVTSLSWSPDGRLLASASSSSPGVDVWHAALGVSTRLKTIQGGVGLLRWSPCGSYLLCGGLDDSFLVWETQKWRSQVWKSNGSGSLVEASWQAGGRAVALAFSGSTQVVMLHFVSPAPSLTAQMLPLDLPELRMLGAGAQGGDVEVEAMAWDPAGGRLAVILRGEHPASGLVALYATSGKSILSAHFIGFARPLCLLSGGGIAATLSPGARTAPMGVAFQGNTGSFKQGALLAVRHGEGHICTIPMYFVR